MTLEILSLYSNLSLLYMIGIVTVGVLVASVWQMTNRDYTKTAEDYFAQQSHENVEVKS